MTVRNGRAIVGGLTLGLFALIAIVGPILIPYDATGVHSADRFIPPLSTTSSRGVAWLGTDELGRDVLAQVVQGARVSLSVGLITVLLAGAVGVALGVVAGYLGGWADSTVSRAIELQLAIPPFLLAILIAAVLGPSLRNLIVALALTRWVKFARVARGSALGLREKHYVTAARVLGAGPIPIIRRHVLPGVMSPILILATIEFGFVILAEAGLSFLGLGTPLSTPSWGLTIATGRQYIDLAWWLSVVPGLALVAVGAAAGLLGDALRDDLDPLQEMEQG